MVPRDEMASTYNAACPSRLWKHLASSRGASSSWCAGNRGRRDRGPSRNICAPAKLPDTLMQPRKSRPEAPRRSNTLRAPRGYCHSKCPCEQRRYTGVTPRPVISSSHRSLQQTTRNLCFKNFIRVFCINIKFKKTRHA